MKPFSELARPHSDAGQDRPLNIGGESRVAQTSAETLKNDARTKAMDDSFGDFKL